MISIRNFLNSSSKDMNVNGSVTPVSFSYSPESGVSAITGMTILFKDDGSTSFDKFGAITALTNGITINTNISSTISTITTIKDNADLCTRFHFNQFGNSAVLNLLSIVTPEGFGNSNNVFIGYMDFLDPIILFNTDSIYVTIQDNLTNIDFIQMACKIRTE